jgi:hypothetical protein
MKCPTCAENTPDDWKTLIVRSGTHPIQPKWEMDMFGPKRGEHGDQFRPAAIAWVQVDWMLCANEACGELVIRMHETRPTGLSFESESGTERDTRTDTWTIRPRFGSRAIDVHVDEPYRTDYLEAAALLDISPRMSAVLSRRLLYDLLETHAEISEYTLKGSIDKFIEDTTHPRKIRENLHVLREMGDFGAHTQKNDQAEIVNVTREEAEWTLDVIDRLFDYFIVAPAKDGALREAWDQKLQETGRNPIPPLPEDVQ